MGTGESEGSNTDKAGPPGLSRWGKQGGEKEGLSSLAGCATIDGRKTSYKKSRSIGEKSGRDMRWNQSMARGRSCGCGWDERSI